MEENKKSHIEEIPTFDNETVLAQLSAESQPLFNFVILPDGIAKWDEASKKYRMIVLKSSIQ